LQIIFERCKNTPEVFRFLPLIKQHIIKILIWSLAIRQLKLKYFSSHILPARPSEFSEQVRKLQFVMFNANDCYIISILARRKSNDFYVAKIHTTTYYLPDF
jgi:hypothetical protein